MLKKRSLSPRAFTLIELLVVILIIGILIAVAAPSFLGQQDKAHDSEAKQALSVSAKNVKAIFTSNGGQFPAQGVIVDDLNEAEPQYTYVEYVEGGNENQVASTENVSVLRETDDGNVSVSMCHQSESDIFFCLETDGGGNLKVLASGTSLLDKLTGTETAYAATTTTIYSHGANEEDARDALEPDSGDPNQADAGEGGTGRAGWNVTDVSGDSGEPGVPPAVIGIKSGFVGNNASTGSHVLDIPEGVTGEDDELLLAVWATPNMGVNEGSPNFPAGWTVIKRQTTTPRYLVAYRDTDGSEGSNFALSGDSSGKSVWHVLRVQGWDGTTAPEVVGADGVGDSTAPDPPSFDPSWNSNETLSVAYTSWTWTTLSTWPGTTAYPEGYNDGTIIRTVNAYSGAGIGLSVANKAVGPGAEDPGEFTLSLARPWRAGSIAIRGN